ncbi:MAG: MerR family transcriptional regulator [Alphaproteobacteria bacterium]|nr:MerR family transcriptional regulator [Alphaproteobacteria bacterium]
MVVNKSKSAFKTIAEVAEELGVAAHVLRFWETKFSQIKPMKTGGGRRYYRPDDVEVIKLIKNLLYSNRYTIEGAQQLIKSKGLKNLLGNEEIQKDFFADNLAEAEKKVEAPAAVVNRLKPEILRGISDAVGELKILRNKLAGM